MAVPGFSGDNRLSTGAGTAACGSSGPVAVSPDGSPGWEFRGAAGGTVLGAVGVSSERRGRLRWPLRPRTV